MRTPRWGQYHQACVAGGGVTPHQALTSHLQLLRIASLRLLEVPLLTVNTAELTDISIKELEDDIVSYTNKGNEVIIDSPVNFVGLFDCSTEPSSIVAEDKARNEAVSINNWGSKLRQIFCDVQLLISPQKSRYATRAPATI